jgi:hypothetical protein
MKKMDLNILIIKKEEYLLCKFSVIKFDFFDAIHTFQATISFKSLQCLPGLVPLTAQLLLQLLLRSKLLRKEAGYSQLIIKSLPQPLQVRIVLGKQLAHLVRHAHGVLLAMAMAVAGAPQHPPSTTAGEEAICQVPSPRSHEMVAIVLLDALPMRRLVVIT